MNSQTDGRSVVVRDYRLPISLFRVDLDTGAATLLKDKSIGDGPTRVCKHVVESGQTHTSNGPVGPAPRGIWSPFLSGMNRQPGKGGSFAFAQPFLLICLTQRFKRSERIQQET